MKVLSIKEPFASLVSLGIKRIETRSWKTNYRGEVYIHASLTKNKIEKERKEKILKLFPKDYKFKEGFIICKAYLKDCVLMDEKFLDDIKKNETEYLCGCYEKGRYAWILDNVSILKNKIPAKGKLGIWNLN